MDIFFGIDTVLGELVYPQFMKRQTDEPNPNVV